ncbi:hypothetical protein GOODEAATRI_033166 [Goodea atripinnis]|uniref:Uncharacterized protein n=1 Tax=Goodea atripinnis TaxID=208336 RepID=A0ABV0PTM2_9TELE
MSGLLGIKCLTQGHSDMWQIEARIKPTTFQTALLIDYYSTYLATVATMPCISLLLRHTNFIFRKLHKNKSSAQNICQEQTGRTPKPGLQKQNDNILFLQPWKREQTLKYILAFMLV